MSARAGSGSSSARCRRRAGTAVGVTLATPDRREAPGERAAALRVRTRPPRRKIAPAGARRAEGVARRHGAVGCGSSPRAIRRARSSSSSSAWRSRCTGQQADAKRAWQAAKKVQPDSPVGGARRRSGASERASGPAVRSCRASRSRRAPRRAAPASRRGLQQALSSRLCAEREFRATAAAVAPNDPEALTARGRRSLRQGPPGAAFSRLGPLSRRFPNAQTVRFHLGLLLIYSGQLACPSRIGPRPRARPDDPAWKEGRNASSAQVETARTIWHKDEPFGL